MKQTIMTPEEYRRNFKVGGGLFESELGRRIERYGSIAQVRNISVARSTPSGPVDSRWINYYQLYWDGTRWWIAGIVWEQERPSTPIPKEWIGKWEEVTK